MKQFKLISTIKQTCLMAIILLFATNLFSQVQIGTTNYTTLAAAFSAINAGSYTGNIIVKITGSTTETTTAQLLASGLGTANYSSVTIYPTVTATINLNSNVIYFVGVDNSVFDGRINQTGSTNSLTISNGSFYLVSNGAGAGCTNDIIRNCNLIGTGPANGSFVMLISGSDNNNNQILYNNMYNSFFGLYISGDADYLTTNLEVKGNVIGSSNSANMIGHCGIYVVNVTNSNFDYNEIFGINQTDNTSETEGIFISTGVTNSNFNGNKIHGMYNTNGVDIYGSDYSDNLVSANGIYIQDDYNANLYFTNNVIYDVISNDNWYYYESGAYGFFVNQGSEFYFYNNTVSLSGNRDVNGTAYAPSSCLGVYSIGSSAYGLYIQNNIFKNTITTGGAANYALLCYQNSPFYSIDYNAYYVSGSDYGIAFNWWGDYYTTLADWQGFYGDDANSVVNNATFISSSNYHLNGASNGDATLLCPVSSYALKDLDGETRNANTYMGADEINTFLTFNPNVVSGNNLLCAGGYITWNYTASMGYADGITRTYTSGHSLTNQWYRNGTLISGATNNYLSISNLQTSDAGVYYSVVTLDGKNYTTNSSTISVQQAIQITNQTSSSTFCSTSSNPTLTASYVGTINNMNWQIETTPGVYSNIAGATNSNYTVNLSQLPITDQSKSEQSAKYRLAINGPGNCGNATVYSDPILIDEYVPINNYSISLTEGSVNPCYTSTIIMTCDAAGSVVAYQWYKDGMKINLSNNASAQSKSLIIDNITGEDNGDYQCLITGCSVCGTSSYNTNIIEISALIPQTFLLKPISKTLCLGESTDFSVSTQGMGTSLSYQWQKDGVNITDNPSAQKQMLLIDSAIYNNAGAYRCVVSVEDCFGVHDIISDDAILNILEKVQITEVTNNVATPVGGIAILQVKSHVFDNPSYNNVNVQWYKGLKPLTNGTRIAGAQSSILTIKDITTSDFGNDYWVVVTGDCGSATATGIQISTSGISIATQPVSATICEGSTNDITVTANPVGLVTDLKYQWLYNGVAINDNENYSGTDKSTLTIKNASITDAGSYSVQVTGNPGNVVVTSLSAKIVVKVLPVITTELNSTMSVKVGDKLEIICLATSDETVTYKWYKDGVEITGLNSSTFVTASAQLTDAGNYQCKVSNSCGEVSSNVTTVTVSSGLPNSVNDNNIENLSLSAKVTPNPFTNDAKLSFNINYSSKVKVILNNTLGQNIAVLSDMYVNAGNNQINVNINSTKLNLVSGVYYLIIETEKETLSKEIIFIR